MRHYNPRASYSSCSHRRGEIITEPYVQLYTYTKPSMRYMYMKLIQYIADHPGLKRKEIVPNVWKSIRATNPGYMSGPFAVLLNDDYIDYDKQYRYFITDLGRALLEGAYLNDCAKLCSGER